MYIPQEYKVWLSELKSKIRSSQIKAAVTVNAALILFYWELGQMISEKQTRWGTQFLENLSKDLLGDFPDLKGLSVRNLKYCRQFYQFYQSEIGQQPVAQFGNHMASQIPWGHNILIFSKSKIHTFLTL